MSSLEKRNAGNECSNGGVDVSVIIVTYNAEEFLDATLQSIFAQDYPSHEIIVVDGMSTDRTVDIIKRYEPKIASWVSEADEGIYDAMNKALRMVKGSYIQFLNAGDNYANNNVLSSIFMGLTETPVLIYGDIKVKNVDGKETYHKADVFNLPNLISKGTGVLCHQAMFVRRDVVPSYNTSYKYKAELNWYFDICELEEFTYKYEPIPIVTYSLGGFGYQNFLKNRAEWIKVVLLRYGPRTLCKSGLIPFLYMNSLYRYPLLATFHNTVTKPVKTFKRLFS